MSLWCSYGDQLNPPTAAVSIDRVFGYCKIKCPDAIGVANHTDTLEGYRKLVKCQCQIAKV